MKKARKICLYNKKGGVGKTTITYNVGYELAKKGYKVLLVDIDPQCNLSLICGVSLTAHPTIYDNIVDGNLGVVPVRYDGMDDIILDLMVGDFKIEDLNTLSHEEKAIELLDIVLDNYITKYDYILIDAPPSFDLIAQNALVASNDVYIVLKPEYLSVQGIALINNKLDSLRKKGYKIQQKGFIFNQYINQGCHYQGIIDAIADKFGGESILGIINQNITWDKATIANMPITLFNNRQTKATEALEQIVGGILTNEKS